MILSVFLPPGRKDDALVTLLLADYCIALHCIAQPLPQSNAWLDLRN